MADTQSTTKFRADISQLKKEMQAASRAVRLASAEFKAATAGMDDWGSSADGLQAKLKQLNTTLDQQKKMLEIQKKELDATVAAYGENSAAADRARIAVYNQEAAIAKTEKQLKEYGDALGDAENGTEDLEDALEEAADSAEEAGDGFTVMKGALANLAAEGIKRAVDGLVDFAKESIKAGKEFEAEMSKVEAISGATGRDMDKLTEKAKELGASTIFSAQQAAEAMEYMAMAGWETSEMLDGIEGVMNLAAASGADLATTSDIVTDALTAMGYSAGDAGRLADVMAAASSNANTNVELMGATFKYVAPIAGALGYDMEDLGVAIGLMANAGIKGEKAGTALRSVLTRLSAPPKECKEEMDKLGISLTDSEGTMKDMSEVIDDLRQAFVGMSKSEQTAAAKRIAGQEAMSGLLAIVNAAPKDIDKLTNAIENSSGAAAVMADVMQDNLQGAMTELESATEGLQIALYDSFLAEPLTEAAETAAGAIRAITEAITPEKTVLDSYIEEVGDAIEATQKTIEYARQAIENGEADASRLETYKQILMETNGSMDEFSQYQIKAIVDELADSVPELAAAWDENTQSLNLTNAEIEALIGNQEEIVLQQSQMEARASAMRAYTDAQVEAAKAQSAFNQALEEANKETGQSFKTYGDAVRYYSQTGVALTKTYYRLSEANGQIGEANQAVKDAKDVYDLTDKALSEMDTSAKSAGETMEKTADSAGDLAEETEALTTSAEAAAEAYEEAGDRIAEAFDKAMDEAQKAFEINPFDEWKIDDENGLTKMKEALDSQIQGLTEYSGNLDVVRQNLSQTSPEFVAYLEDMGTAGAQVVKELADAFGRGDTATVDALLDSYVQAVDKRDELSATIAADQTAIEAGLGKLGSSAREWAKLTDVVDALEGAGGKLSAETVKAFEEAAQAAQAAGVAIPKGLEEGIESEDPEGAVRDAIDQINAAITGQGQALMDIAAAQGIQVPEGITSGIEAGGQDAVEAYQALLALITGSADSASKEAEDGGQGIADSTAEGIENNEKTVTTAAEGMTQAAVKATTDKSKEFDSSGKASAMQYAGAINSQSGAASAAGANLASSARSGTNQVSSYSSGVYFGQGYINGISSMVSAAYAKAYELARQAHAGLKAGQQEGSPSKLTTQSGKYFTQGFINGIVSMESKLIKSVGSLAKAAIKELNGANRFTVESIGEAATNRFADMLSEKTDYILNRVSYQNEKKMAEFDKEMARLKAQSDKKKEELQKASDARVAALQAKSDATTDKAQKAALKAQINNEKAAAKRLIKLNEKSYDKLISRQEKYKAAYQTASSQMITELQKAMDKYSQAAQDLVDNVIGGISDRYTEGYDLLQEKQDSLIQKMLDAGTLYDISPAGVMTINDLQEQTRQIREYASQLQTIRSKISKELFDEITQLDAKEGQAYISQLLGLSEEELRAYDQAYVERLKAAQSAGSELYKPDFTALEDAYAEELKAASKSIKKQMEEMGKQAMEGFLQGFRTNTGYMDKTVKTFVSSMIEAFKKELKIHSPSRVTEGLGEYTGEGFAEGILGTIKKVRDAVRQMASEVSSPIGGLGADISGIRQTVNGQPIMSGAAQNVVNNYNLVQNNTSPKALTALETYQARRQQIAMIKAVS